MVAKKKIEEEDNANFSHGMGAKEENGRSQREQKAESKAEMFSTWVNGEYIECSPLTQMLSISALLSVFCSLCFLPFSTFASIPIPNINALFL